MLNTIQFWVITHPYISLSAAVVSVILSVFLFRRLKRGRVSLPESSELKSLKKELDDLKSKVEQSPQEKVPTGKTLKEALSQTRAGFWGRISQGFSASASRDDHLELIEEVLYTSDLGPKTVQKLFSNLEEKVAAEMSEEDLKTLIRAEITELFASTEDTPFVREKEGLVVWMIVGVNGAGKTTTIGKLSSQLQQEGKKVMIAAGDTFRAAADEQLKVWSDRANVEIFSPENVKDPSAVAFDAVNKAQSGGFDILIIDTAGRLHTQKNLMEELKKMKRVTTKVLPEAPDEVILVLDANSGQNALIQAEQFHEALGVTGVVLTKMDGSAKGGVAVGVVSDVGLPVKMIGVGETVSDLRPFSRKDFVDSLF